MRSDLSPFLNWSIEITFILLLVSMVIAFVRLVRGPSLPDRIVALDLLTLLAVGVIALFAIREDKPVFLDAAIALALVAFLGTVAYARFLERRGRHLTKDRRSQRTMIGTILEILAGLLLLAGGAFLADQRPWASCRLPDVLIRMHASSKAGTVGAGMILLAVGVLYGSGEIMARVGRRDLLPAADGPGGVPHDRPRRLCDGRQAVVGDGGR